jgi:hypothetical protein
MQARMGNGEHANAGFQSYRITLPIGHDTAGTFGHRQSRKVRQLTDSNRKLLL